MAFTQTDLDAINAVIASGQLTVRFADRQVTYQNTEALLRARQLILDEMNSVGGTSRRRIVRLSQTGNGYGC